jgi:serine/threonine-protein kinase
MSPEQARGAVVDRRTDIFALGIVLYKLTTGLHPFLGDSDMTTLRNIMSRPVIPPRINDPTFPSDVEQVLSKCLDKDPAKRYQTMAELGAAVERLLAASASEGGDLGGFVRTTMGNHGAKRRAAIRDAVRAADERFAAGMQPVALSTAGNVADTALARASSTVDEQAISDPAVRSALTSTSFASASAPSAVSQSGPRVSASQPQGQSLTQPPLSVSPVSARPARRAPLLAAVGFAAVIVGVAGVHMTRGRAASAAPADAPPTLSEHAPLASTGEPPRATPSATASPLAPTSASAVASASPAPPSATPSAATASATTARARAIPKALPAAKPPGAEKATQLSNGKVPIYTTPGF